MTDYSQFGEQGAILEALKSDVLEPGDPGRFLDIGAWHPKQFSNTRALYELGWSGVMIEPSSGPMLNLLEEYGNDERVILVQAVVAPGWVTLHVSDDAVSTASEAEYDKWKDTAKFRGRVLVPSISVEEIAQRWGGFDFVSIDAEGESAWIFLRMLELGQFPTVVCVEHDGRLHDILAAATKEHYKAVLVNSTNAVLVR